MHRHPRRFIVGLLLILIKFGLGYLIFTVVYKISEIINISDLLHINISLNILGVVITILVIYYFGWIAEWISEKIHGLKEEDEKSKVRRKRK